jgi:hypothetical protein
LTSAAAAVAAAMLTALFISREGNREMTDPNKPTLLDLIFPEIPDFIPEDIPEPSEEILERIRKIENEYLRKAPEREAN